MSAVLDQIRALKGTGEDPSDVLMDERNQEIEAMRPRPTCCGRGETRIRLRAFFEDGESSDQARGSWCLGDHSDLVACPFCGKPLPAVWRKPVQPENLCRITDGGYRCDRCGDRLGRSGCWCDPLESAFEPLPADVSPHTLERGTYTIADVETYRDPHGLCWLSRLRFNRGLHESGSSPDEVVRKLHRNAEVFGYRLVPEK